MGIAALLGIPAVFGGFYYLDMRNRGHDREIDAEYTRLFREAHKAAATGRYADDIDGFVKDGETNHREMVFWDAQYIRPNRTIWREGNATDVTLPNPIPRDWFETTAATVRDGKTADIQVRGKAIVIGDRQPIVVFVGRDITNDASQVRDFSWATLGALVGIGIFVLLSALMTARYVWSRVRDISRTAEDIIGGDLSRRIRVGPSHDEFDALSETLNVMLDRIERLLTGMKEVSDNIAHDLRTPLYRMKSRIELAIVGLDKGESQLSAKEALEQVLRESDKLLGTFNALLSIARLESGAMRDNMTDVDLGEVVADVADLFEPAAEDRGLVLQTEAEKGLAIKGNRALIVQALSNLVDNALKYSPPGGRVVLRARRVAPTRLLRETIDLVVCDQGPGIAQSDRRRVLERFVRLDQGQGAPGSGLGLSLVSAIAKLHEAGLVLEETEGGGLTVRLRFTAL